MEKSLRSRIIAVAMIAALCVTALVGLFFSQPIQKYSAAGEANGLRFQQVALGKDFAVGLTYDGDLYGWDTAEIALGSNNALGTSYGTSPKKIDVQLVVGPSVRTGDNAIIMDNSAAQGDRIIKVAATLTTAAFITKAGNIYTWGVNDLRNADGYGMLLRKTVAISDPVPVIIDYACTSDSISPAIKRMVKLYRGSDSESVIPNEPTDVLLDIVGSENNYVVKHKRSDNNNPIRYFGWGSSKYLTTAVVTSSDTNVSTGIYEFATSAGSAPNANLTVGGNAVMIAEGNTLYMRGKNYYVPSTDAYTYSVGTANYISDPASGGTSGNYDVLYLDNTANLYTGDSRQDAYTWTEQPLRFAASKDSASAVNYLVNEGISTNSKTDIPYDFYAVENSKALTNSPITFKNAEDGSASDISAFASTLSLGNGYGYYISNGELYFFGNGYNNQSGKGDSAAYASLTAVNGFTGTPVTVAAGKTETGRDIFSDLDGTMTDGNLTFTTNALDGAKVDIANLQTYADGTNFLSGLITKSGSDYHVYVWNKDIGFTSLDSQFSDYGVYGKDSNRIVNLYSGYGNNLIALSSLGKVYQISHDGANFVVELKDSFVNADGSKVVNYSTEQSNKIKFSLSNGRPYDAAQVQKTDIYATLDINSIVPSGDNVLASDYVYDSVIKTNAVGDAYRMLLAANDTNLQSRAIVSNKLVGDATATVADNGGIRFYFKDDMTSEIPAEILKHYLDYEISTSGGNVSVKIMPYQSTKDKTIVMQYYVGRYDSYVNKSASLASDFKFYDYDLVSTEITIANSQAQFNHFDNRVDGVASNNISIPVLDPNNPKNNTYSIALTNVQYGLETLAKQFGVASGNLQNFNSLVVEKAYANDVGFPAAKKVADGYLERYFNESGTDKNYKHSTYYNDTYQYIAFDSDGDRLSFETANFEDLNASSFFQCRKETVSFRIPLSGSGYNLSNLTADSLKTFNNIYGLTLSVVTENSELSVSYDVLQLVARASTGDLEYADSDIRKPLANKDINDLKRYSLSLSETYYNTAANGNTTVYNENPVIVPAFVQGSMQTRISDEANGGYYRSESGHNEFTVAEPTITVGAASDSGRIYTFDLENSGLFYDYSNIFLTFKTEGDTVSYADYGQTGFVGTFGSLPVNVSLDKRVLKFEAKSPDVYRFSIELRRFTRADMSQPILSDGKEGEYIKLWFVITAAPSSFQNEELNSLAKQTVTEETSYSVTQFTNAKDAVFTDCMSSDKDIATVKLSANKKEIIVSPISSGNITVLFSVSQYISTPKSGMFEASIEGRTTLNEIVSLIGSETIYLSDLKREIAKDYKGDGAFNTKEYSLDKESDANAPEGFYFVQKSINETTQLVEWKTISQPPFIGKIFVAKDDSQMENAIKIEISGSYDNKANYDNIKLVVKFVGTNGKRFEAAIQIMPSKKYLVNDDGGDLNIVVDVKSELISDTTSPRMTGDGSFIVPMKYLTDRVPNMNSSDYSIQLVATSEAAYKYFNINNIGNNIIVTPFKSTDKMYAVDVSVSENDTGTPYVLSFYISVKGIIEVLPKSTYVTIWLACSISVFAVLFILFIIRMGIYWKKKAEQKRIIKKNQMLIKMRDKVHNKTEAISKEQIVQTKLKMEDPKYAKMFNEMKKTTEERTGITLDNSTVAKKAEAKTKAMEKGKKKKNGKKSIEELKAELAAKKEAFAKIQMGEEVPLTDISGTPTFNADYADGMSREDIENQINEKINSDGNILFDVETLDDNK